MNMLFKKENVKIIKEGIVVFYADNLYNSLQ
jgi:hypothetical protein